MKRKKGSASSVVLTTFAILIYIVIPLGKAAFEQVYFQSVREKMIVILDAAVFAAAANVNTEDFSERRLSIMKEEIEAYIFQKNDLVAPQKIDLSLEKSLLKVEMWFKIYSIFRDREDFLKIEGLYRFEILDRPAF